MSNSISTSRFTCTLCTRSRSYKTQRGLQRHETIKHKEHNILPSHILPLPKYELDHVKKVMVREIQKRLKKHHRTAGNQVFSLHCSENDFVGIFGKYFTRYSPCGNFYQCHFSGDNSYNILTNIFNDAMWRERDYGNGQLSWVKLVDEMNCNSQTELYIE